MGELAGGCRWPLSVAKAGPGARRATILFVSSTSEDSTRLPPAPQGASSATAAAGSRPARRPPGCPPRARSPTLSAAASSARRRRCANVGGARQAPGRADERQHPDDRLLGDRQDDLDARGGGASWPPTLGSPRSTLVRLHANVLGEEAARGRPGEAVLTRLLERAREQLPEPAAAARAGRRGARPRPPRPGVHRRGRQDPQPGRRPSNVEGIRAQEALLTLIENEAVPFDLPEWPAAATSASTPRTSSSSAPAPSRASTTVYDRVTIGRDRGALKPVTVRRGGRGPRRRSSSRCATGSHQDLFDYGMSPQFLSRFDAVVLLEDLAVDELLKIFVESPDSACCRAAPTSPAAASASPSPRPPSATSPAPPPPAPPRRPRPERGLPPHHPRLRVRARPPRPRRRPADRRGAGGGGVGLSAVGSKSSSPA